MRRLLRWLTWIAVLTLTGCQTILSLEEARLDPSLSAKPDVTELEEDEPTTAPAPTSDAGSSGMASSDPAQQCEGFDNSRVKLLRADGTLPPLPDAPSTPAN